MALSRKYLKAMGLTDEQVDSVIEAHQETISALKETNAKLQEDLENASKNPKESEYKAKYEEVQKEFNAYKTQQVEKETREAKESAYTKLLKDAKISDKMISKILKITDFKDLELDEKGNFKDEKKISKDITSEWGEYAVAEKSVGAKVDVPPANHGSKTMTKAEIMKITDREERRQAIKENAELFK